MSVTTLLIHYSGDNVVKASKSWGNQLKEYGVGQENNFTKDVYYSYALGYTQVSKCVSSINAL